MLVRVAGSQVPDPQEELPLFCLSPLLLTPHMDRPPWACGRWLRRPLRLSGQRAIGEVERQVAIAAQGSALGEPASGQACSPER